MFWARNYFPDLARNTYIHLVVGLRAKYYMHLVVVVGLRGKVNIFGRKVYDMLYDML